MTKMLNTSLKKRTRMYKKSDLNYKKASIKYYITIHDNEQGIYYIFFNNK